MGFTKIDKDGSNEVDCHELLSFLHSLGQRATTDSVKKFMRRLHPDKDALTFDDFLVFLANWSHFARRHVHDVDFDVNETFLAQPPSYKLDVCMRILYLPMFLVLVFAITEFGNYR